VVPAEKSAGTARQKEKRQMKIKTNVRAGSGTKTQNQTHSSAPVYVPPIILGRCIGIV
jgi:hypothetical protein